MSSSAISPEQALLLQKENTGLRVEIDQLTARCAELQAKLALLLKKYFCGGQSATLDHPQLLLAIDGLKKEIAATTPPAETITYERSSGPAPKRTLPVESFAHLPVKETIEISPEAVKKDPSLDEKIGEERTFEVDIVLPKLFKREIVRPKFKHCLDPTRGSLLGKNSPVRRQASLRLRVPWHLKSTLKTTLAPGQADDAGTARPRLQTHQTIEGIARGEFVFASDLRHAG